MGKWAFLCRSAALGTHPSAFHVLPNPWFSSAAEHHGGCRCGCQLQRRGTKSKAQENGVREEEMLRLRVFPVFPVFSVFQYVCYSSSVVKEGSPL